MTHEDQESITGIIGWPINKQIEINKNDNFRSDLNLGLGIPGNSLN